MSEILAAWQERFRPRPVELSNGLKIVIRPVSVAALALAGQIPQTIVTEARAGRKAKKGDEAAGLIDPQMAQVIHAVIMAAAVEPRVTAAGTEPTEDSIPLDWIQLADRVRIFEEANSAATALEPFREQPGGDAGDARDSENLRETAE